jgi:hypothetical protein
MAALEVTTEPISHRPFSCCKPEFAGMNGAASIAKM